METQPLRIIDRNTVIARLPGDVLTLMIESNLILAGGFIRAVLSGTKASDIDLFGSLGLDGMRPIADRLAEARKGSTHQTERAAQFDFTVAQGAIWWDADDWKSLASSDFYPDLAARRLVYAGTNAIADVGGSLLRMRKFLAAGYSIQVPSLARLVSRMAFNVKEFEAANIDEAKVCRVIEGLLRELDPSLVTAQEGV